jgi:hypothetical protein
MPIYVSHVFVLKFLGPFTEQMLIGGKKALNLISKKEYVPYKFFVPVSCHW